MSSGIVTSLNAYVNSVGTATTLYLAMYDSGGTLMVSGSQAVTSGLNTIAVPSVAVFAGQQYFLTWQADVSLVIADNGSTFQALQTSNTIGTFPSTIPISGGSSGNVGLPSIFAGGTTSNDALLVGPSGPVRTGTGGGGTGNLFFRQNGFIAGGTGTVTSLNMYVQAKGTATSLWMGLYDSGGNKLVAANQAIVNGLNNIPVTATPVQNAQTYFIVWQADASITPVDDGTTFKVNLNTNTFGSLPATLSLPGTNINGGVPTSFAMGPLLAPSTPFTQTIFFVTDRVSQF